MTIGIEEIENFVIYDDIDFEIIIIYLFYCSCITIFLTYSILVGNFETLKYLQEKKFLFVDF